MGLNTSPGVFFVCCAQRAGYGTIESLKNEKCGAAAFFMDENMRLQSRAGGKGTAVLMEPTTTERKENIMGTRPVNGLLVSMAVPLMLSMLVQALYNIVDSVFVSMVSEAALTSVSLIFPVQNLMIAVAAGTGVGLNALLSRRLGEKSYEEANHVAENGVFLILISWAVTAVLGALFSDAFLRAFTSDPEIAAMGAAYMRICTIFSFGLYLQITFERILQVTGKTVYPMISQMSGAVINIILDPVMIFGLCGVPKMGVAGAAWATVIGQIGGMCIGIALNHCKNHEVRMHFAGFRPSRQIIRGIYAVGVPSIIMQSIGSVMVFGMNKILIAFTKTAVSVFGVYFKLQSFVFMPVFGISNALIPIVGYNYGARRPRRIHQTLHMAMILSLAIMAAGTAVFELAPRWLLSLFSASDAMYEVGVPALRILAVPFCVAGVAICCSSMFQALGDGMLSLIISAVRQLAFLLPAAWLLARMGGLHAVWWSFPIAEAASITVTLLFVLRVRRRKLDPMEREENARSHAEK